MGYIKNVLKNGAANALNQVKNYDVAGEVNSKLGAMNIDIPKLEVPSEVKNWKLNIDPSVIQLPAGVDSYISPIVSKVASFAGIKLPSEIGGVSLPEMPDLSSVASEVDGFLKGIGFDTNSLGIRSVSDILDTPDLSSLKSVQFDSRLDLNNMPDVTKSLDSFDMEGLQSQIDELTSQFPEMDNIDISQYF